MPDRGKLVVVSIFVLAVALAAFAVYWQWRHRGRSADFWGPEVSRLLREAKHTELLVLKPSDPEQETDAGEMLRIAGEPYEIAAILNLNHTPGLIHARHSLTEDASFVWNDPGGSCSAVWTHAVRFRGETDSAVIAFDFQCRRVLLLEGEKSVSVVPRIADGFQRIFERAANAESAAR